MLHFDTSTKMWVSERDTNGSHWSTLLEVWYIPQHRSSVAGCVRPHLDYSNTVFLPGIYFSRMDCADLLWYFTYFIVFVQTVLSFLFLQFPLTISFHTNQINQQQWLLTLTTLTSLDYVWFLVDWMLWLQSLIHLASLKEKSTFRVTFLLWTFINIRH